MRGSGEHDRSRDESQMREQRIDAALLGLPAEANLRVEVRDAETAERAFEPFRSPPADDISSGSAAASVLSVSDARARLHRLRTARRAHTPLNRREHEIEHDARERARQRADMMCRAMSCDCGNRGHVQFRSRPGRPRCRRRVSCSVERNAEGFSRASRVDHVPTDQTGVEEAAATRPR